MIEPAQLAHDILDHACPNYVDDNGWNHYYIETHCVAWKITARKSDAGWVIREVKSEDC